MSTDAHELQMANRALESTINEQRRTIMQLEDRVTREEAENRRLSHLVGDKNAEIEDLKTVVHTQKRENVELLEELQRHMSASAASPADSAEPKEKISRWVQTLVDITPPEEVDRMHQQIEELKIQMEQYESELAELGGTYIRQSGMVGDDDSDRGSSPDPEMGSPGNDSMAGAPIRKLPKLQLNFAIPPNIGGVDNETVLTARNGLAPSETPRAHIRIPGTLLTSRANGTTTFNNAPNRDGSTTGRRFTVETPRVQATPRVSTAELMRRSYVDPTTTSSILGDVNYSESHSPNMGSQRAMSTVAGDTPRARADSADNSEDYNDTANVDVAVARGTAITSTGADAHDTNSTKQVNRSVMKSHGTSRSPDESIMSLNGTIAGNADDGQIANIKSIRSSAVTTRTSTAASKKHSFQPSSSGSGDVAVGGGHMFSIEDAEAGCPVCSLMEQIQNMYTGKRVCKEAYYAVGWIPEMCHRWSLEHNIAWTIEERAAVATALTNRTKLSAFTTSNYRGPVNIWRKRPFWRSAWRPSYAVLQGVFLYIFNSSRPNEPVVAIIPVRASFIELVTLNGRSRCLQISSLGCMSCVGANAGDCVETMTISLDTDKELLNWEKALQMMQRTCAHKCSQKFMNEVDSIRDIAEMLLTLAKETDSKIDAKERELAAK